MALACRADEELWVANLYVGVDEKGTTYFVSPESAKHSKMILKNPEVASSFAWFEPSNHLDRKGVQGVGVCRPAKNEVEIATGVRLHNANFPELIKRITIDWIHFNEWGSKVWVLTPSYIKYWDDELYGDEEAEEFKFPA